MDTERHATIRKAKTRLVSPSGNLVSGSSIGLMTGNSRGNGSKLVADQTDSSRVIGDGSSPRLRGSDLVWRKATQKAQEAHQRRRKRDPTVRAPRKGRRKLYGGK